VIKSMSSSEAFEAIDVTIAVIVQQVDNSIVIEILQTLIALAWYSDTIEVHPSLLKQQSNLLKQFSHYSDYTRDKLEELFRFYRLIK
jgi:hypothetical protein